MVAPRRILLRLHRLEDRTAPAAGMLDPTFGIGGRVTTRFSIPSSELGWATAIDGLGRIVIAGQTQNRSNTDFAVARLTPAGALDATFGGSGIVTIGFGVTSDEAFGVAVDSLDRVVVAGRTDFLAVGDFALVRLTAAGALDTSFDGDGKQTINFGSSTDAAYGVAIDSMDRIVVAGSTNNGSNSDFAVARLTVAGALDTSFDGDGKQTFVFGAFDDGASCLAVDSSNRVVVAGYGRPGSNADFAVARLTAAGALDGSFDGDGRQTVGFGTFYDAAASVAIDSLGRIVIAGTTFNGSDYDISVTRVTAAGTLDSSFDGDGKQTLAFGTTFEETGTGVAVDSLDRVVVVGYTYTGSNDDFALARFTTAGALDTSFDGDGKQTVAFGASHNNARGLVSDSQDRVLVGGDTSNNSGNSDFAVTRLTTAGALDSSFDGDGKLILGLTQSQAGSNAVAVDSLGRTVVAGIANNGSNYDFAVTRYTPGGALDTTFGGTGTISFAFGIFDDDAIGVAVDSLNRIVVAGYTLTGSDSDFAVARLTAAGALDVTFDGDGRKTFGFGAFDEKATGVAVDSLDRVVVAGYTDDQSSSWFTIIRLTSAGALDASFDGDGIQTITFGSNFDIAFAVAVDSLDRVVVAGGTHNGNDNDFAIARLTAAGALDNSFDGDGLQTIEFFGSTEVAIGVAVDSLDRIVVAGYTHNFSNFDFAVARLTTAGILDSSFAGDGRQTISFGSSDETGNAVAVDSLNRVIVAGYTSDGSNTDFAVARLTAAGALDGSFDGDGKQTIDFAASYDDATSVAIASADRVVLAGDSIFSGGVFAVARLTGDTTAAAAQVNDGSAQRSRVTSLTVRFSGQVSFNGLVDDAFTLMRTGGGAVTFTVNVSLQYGGTVVTLSNFAGPETEFGSLRDGRYTLTTLASQISAGGQALDGDGNGTPGGDLVIGDAQGLFRFYGDMNGDRRVDIADFGFFSLAFLNQANYNPALDFNNDGRIDIADFGQFSVRFFTTLP